MISYCEAIRNPSIHFPRKVTPLTALAAARGVILRVLCSKINPIGVEKILEFRLFGRFFFLLGLLGLLTVLRVAANLCRRPDTHD